MYEGTLLTVATIFEQEIRAQGALLRARSEQGAEQAAEAARLWGEIDYALVAARGSSDNAAIFFQYLAGRELGLLVALATPWLYESGAGVRLPHAGVLAISQSGRSPGITDVVRVAGEQRCPTIAVTNDADAPLARASDAILDLAVGPERAVASTKTFSATWHATTQLVSALRPTPLAGLEELPDVVHEVASWALGSALPLGILDSDLGLTVVGRGVGYAAAAEAALKIREVTGLRAEGYAAADYLHGPIGAASPGSCLLLLVTDELADEVGLAIVNGCRELGMRSVVVRPIDRRSCNGDEEIVLPVESINPTVGLQHVILGQVMALRIGERRGRPIDTSPGLSKVTSTA